MEIAAFVTGGIVALAGRAVVVSVAASHAQPAQPPPPPPPPPPIPKKPRIRARSNVIPADFDFTQSYIGLNRREGEEPEGIPISRPAEGVASKSAPTFVKDPELLNQTRLRHVDVVRPQIPDRNNSEICRLLGEGKTKLKSVL